MRRIFAGILCMGVLFTGAVPCSASAPLGYDEYGDPIVTATPVPDAQTADSSGQAAADPAPAHSSYYSQAADTDSIEGWPTGPNIEAQAAVLMDVNTEAVLYSKNADTQLYPASITKIMTAMLALKYGNMDDVVTITQENLDLESGSQVCGFWAGDQVTMDQLLHCLLVYSGNDAASAIATHVGGSTEGFVEMMNSFAKELGCTGTHFTNPHGLQDENHYTTPYDIYLMLKLTMMP